MSEPLCADEAREEARGRVENERDRQDAIWGGPSNDDGNTEGDWKTFILEYATGTGRGARNNFAGRMVKVAALAQAALESELRKGRIPNDP